MAKCDKCKKEKMALYLDKESKKLLCDKCTPYLKDDNNKKKCKSKR